MSVLHEFGDARAVIVRNNVTRFLDARGVAYTAHELPVLKLGAEQAAAFLGVAPSRVFKTIVVLREHRGRPLLVLVPGDCTVDLKALARALGEKGLKVATERMAEQLTGLQAGGISPLALLNRGFQVILDARATDHSSVFVSGGQRGLNLEIEPRSLAGLIRARLVPISSPAGQTG